MRRLRLACAAAAILLCPLLCGAQAGSATSAALSPTIREIEITSTRANMGGSLRRGGARPTSTEHPKTVLDIRKNGDVYNLGDDIIDAKLVTALAKALREPANSEPNRDDLGFTPEWLKANAPALGGKFAETMIVGGQRIHESAFESKFTDLAAVDKAIPLLFQRRICADCDRYMQSVDISVRFDDGTRIGARTSSEFPFMLPWHLQKNGTDVVAYNADISRSLAALMPENSANRPHLEGEHLDRKLGQILLMQEEHESQLREVEDQTGETLAAIRAKYTVESANIGDYGDPAIVGKKDEFPDLILRLKTADEPASFSDNVALAYIDGKVIDTDKFMTSGGQFESLVLSVPWLTQYAQNHPKTPIEIEFVHDVSLSDAGLETFRADMRAIGRENVIAKVETQRKRIAFVRVGY
jgi:hypothetical protein